MEQVGRPRQGAKSFLKNKLFFPVAPHAMCSIKSAPPGFAGGVLKQQQRKSARFDGIKIAQKEAMADMRRTIYIAVHKADGHPGRTRRPCKKQKHNASRAATPMRL